MQINKKRVRRLGANLPASLEGVCVVPAVALALLSERQLTQVGFSGSPQAGESVLPAVIGPLTRYNAEGKDWIHRDRPKETCYRQREWTYSQWHGKDQVEVTEIVDVPYQRYPRTRIPPPGVEITVAEQGDQLLLVTEAMPVAFDQPAPLLHAINLFLEAFGTCDIRRQDLSPVTIAPTIYLNWTVLPQGKMPWEGLRPALTGVIETQRPGNQSVVEHRLEKVNSYGADFVAVGRGGFSGYVIFGFPTKNLYVLECTRYGNATYIFERDWEELSRLSKAEILDRSLQRDRLIHLPKWDERINRLLR